MKYLNYLLTCFLIAALAIFSGCGDDDDEGSSFSAEALIEVDEATIIEGSSAVITIALSSPNTTGDEITFTYTTSGSATAQTDYSALSGSVSISEGSSSATIDFSTIEDASIEATETFTLTLADPNVNGLTLAANTVSIDITDNDSRTVSVISSDNTASENSDKASFIIYLNQLLDHDIDIPYSVTGSATSGSDFSALPGVVTIPAGSASVSVDVTPIDDDIVESNETIIVSLENSNLPTGVTSAASSSVTITITDNDVMEFTAEVSITASDATATESSDNGALTISLDKANDSGSTISISYTVSGTATAGLDYTTLSGTAEIPSGNQSVEVVVNVLDDTTEESEETVIVNLSESNLPDGITLGTGSSATVTISDDGDFETTVSIDGTTNAAEPSSNGAFTMSLAKTNTTGVALSIPYTISTSSTADEGSDFNALTGSVSIPDGAASATVDITVIDDSQIENDEELILVIDTDNLPVGITGGTNTESSITIADDDVATTDYVVTIQGKSLLTEDEAQGRFKLVLNEINTTGSDMTFEYDVTGTATSEVDYSALSGTITIPNGEIEAADFVYPIDDTDVEEDETVIITISSNNLPSNVTIGSPDSHTVTIQDNDTESGDGMTIDPSFFVSDNFTVEAKLVDCNLQNGSASKCYELTFKSNPVIDDGPFCPANTSEIGGMGNYDGPTGPGFQAMKATLFQSMEEDGYDIIKPSGDIRISDFSSSINPDFAYCLEPLTDDNLQLKFIIPAIPEFATSNNPISSVEWLGVSLDGVPMNGTPPSVVENNGNIPSLDPCGGHHDPFGYYHWHFIPESIDDVLIANDITEIECTNITQDHTALSGFAKDGFPIYASADMDGSTPNDLDECNGHTSATAQFPDGVYHYHAFGTEAPNIPECLKGVIFTDTFEKF